MNQEKIDIAKKIGTNISKSEILCPICNESDPLRKGQTLSAIIMKENFIISPVLGKSLIPSKADITVLKRIVKESPVTCFQELNKIFNEKGLNLFIDLLCLKDKI